VACRFLPSPLLRLAFFGRRDDVVEEEQRIPPSFTVSYTGTILATPYAFDRRPQQKNKMRVAWITLLCLFGQAAAFAPPRGAVSRSRNPTVRHAGFESLQQEGAALLSAFPEEMKTLVDELSRSIVRVPPVSVDERLIGELVAAATTPLHLVAIGLFTLGSAFFLFINTPVDFSEAPFEPGTDTYDPKVSDEFYSKRPLMVVRRLLKLAVLTGTFNSGVLFDWLVLGKLFKDEEYTALKKAEPKRAKQALVLCEQLGPTFIKLGQAISIRTDLVPEAYALELRQLQDAVPPFPSDAAYEILKKEFGVSDLRQIFSTLSEKPVASASIGQVYRGLLASNGKEVAVKVQRPGILSEIALDLYILRLISPLQTRLSNTINGRTTDQQDIDVAKSLVDEWGRGFVAETVRHSPIRLDIRACLYVAHPHVHNLTYNAGLSSRGGQYAHLRSSHEEAGTRCSMCSYCRG
jgi:hypothetical protein